MKDNTQDVILATKITLAVLGAFGALLLAGYGLSRLPGREAAMVLGVAFIVVVWGAAYAALRQDRKDETPGKGGR